MVGIYSPMGSAARQEMNDYNAWVNITSKLPGTMALVCRFNSSCGRYAVLHKLAWSLQSVYTWCGRTERRIGQGWSPPNPKANQCWTRTQWQLMTCKGPFTHAIFDAISDAISRTKRARPYPARMFISRSILWIGKKGITYYLKTPFFRISANLAVFCCSITRLQTRAG